ncbi:hypothetical protein HYALB_00012299 [Hymenoscyphus albidus]|uniref:Clr5 domain-containing protein n=1 Tax=Hymenoscyphus albidus TaxID=595503 RepID=A0A9N9LWF5_9HELO|nr:hypothetical protein HYALB_00012299 [Hymenoscyphus albidus]
MNTMDIRNVELSIEDILSIHRHWISKLYLDDHKSEMEIVDMLYERRLPVTVSQVRNCLSEWTLISLPPTLRRGSSSNSSTIDSEDDWEALRVPSPTSSTTSYYSTTPKNIDLYSKRPLPSLPKAASISGTKSKLQRLPKLRHARSNVQTSTNTSIPTRFANRVPALNLNTMITQQSHTPSYEAEATFSPMSPIECGLSPIEIFTSDMAQRHEMIAVGLRRIEYPGKEKEGDDFEWMKQFHEYKIGSGPREVKIHQGEDLDYEADEE